MDRKRTHSDLESETNQRNNKKFNFGSEPAVPGSDSTVYRILCPGNVIGNVIGKGGKVIKSLRKETRSKIKVADPCPGVDERVIIIFSDKVNIKDKDNEKNGGNDEGEGEDEPVCPAQDGLLRVHSVIVQADSHKDKDKEKDNITCRLLVPNSQIGSLIGKGGKNIQKMRSDCGAQIQILRKEQLPGCALPFDELVQISGDAAAVKKALYVVSAYLHNHPPKEQIPWKHILPAGNQNSIAPTGSLLPSANYFSQGTSIFGHNSISAPLMGMGSHLTGLGGYTSEAAGGTTWPLSTASLPLGSSFGSGSASRKEEFTIRMLCPSDKIGGVIGKGGNNIKQVRQETGASVKVEDPKEESDERVIVVSYTELADDRVSPTLEAVLHLQGRTCVITDKEGVISTRLLVPSRQIGCLIGKGGNVITEMRKITRANIRIFPKDERPKCASEDEELVQITAEANIARDALIQIVTRLRDNIFKDKDSSNNTEPMLPSSLSGLAMPTDYSLSSSYATRPDIESLGGMIGARSVGGYASLGALQGGAGSYAPLSAYSSTGTYGGGLSGGHLNSTYSKAIEMSIPISAVGSVLGRGGSNISHIRQVSGASVKLHDPLPGASDRVIEILGTPEQQHAAKSLIQAYMLSGQSHQSHVPLRAY